MALTMSLSSGPTKLIVRRRGVLNAGRMRCESSLPGLLVPLPLPRLWDDRSFVGFSPEGIYSPGPASFPRTLCSLSRMCDLYASKMLSLVSRNNLEQFLAMLESGSTPPGCC